MSTPNRDSMLQASESATMPRELEALERDAIRARRKAAGLESIFVLTTRTMHWFIKRGFAPVDPDWLPEARKRKYNWDRRSQVLVKKL